MSKKPLIFAIANQKGGVGKTSTAHLLGLSLQASGSKVLLVDLDPQTNLTYIAGAFGAYPTVKEILEHEATPQDAIYTEGSLDIIPGSTELLGADDLLEDINALKDALEAVGGAYNVIIIDCPPGLGILTANALTAAQRVIIPCGADILSIQGLSQLLEFIEAVKSHSNKALKISGILITRLDSRTNLSKELSEELERIRAKLKIKLFNTKIRSGAAVPRYQAKETDPLKDRRAGVIQDYLAFTEELKAQEGL